MGGFGQWYESQHARLLFAVTLLAGDVDVARDITGEAFSRAFEQWERVEVMANPTGWTYTVALNLLRRRARRRRLESRALNRTPTWTALDGRSDLEIDVMNALWSLPPRSREAVFLRYYAGMSEPQVATAMKVAPGTVSATLSAARRRLAELLADYSPVREEGRASWPAS